MKTQEEDQMDLESQEREEEERKENATNFDQRAEDPSCPIIPISKEKQKELCKPWRSALIVKLLGKRISMHFLHARLLKLWNLFGGFKFINVENDYYLVRFSYIKDIILFFKNGYGSQLITT